MIMKQIAELTSKELMELTEVDKKSIIDLECAVRGIKLLPEQPISPNVIKPEKDTTVYEIAGFNFLDSKEANEVLTLLENTKSRVGLDSKNYDSNYYVRPLQSYYEPKIETNKVYSAESYVNIKVELDKYTKAKEAYNKLKGEYDNCKHDIVTLKKELQDAIDTVFEYSRNVEKFTDLFARYLKLANNDKLIAKNFLISSYPDAEEFEEVTALWGDK